MSDSRCNLTITEDISAMKTKNFPRSKVRECMKRYTKMFGQGFGIIIFNLGIIVMLAGMNRCCDSTKNEVTYLSIADQSIEEQPDQSIPVEWIPKATIPHFYYQPNSKPDYCNDFYGTVCNSTVEKRMKFSDPEDDHLHLTARKQFREKFGMLLIEPLRPSEPQTARDAKSLYRFCMNEESIDKRGLDSVKTFLNELGGWPNLNATWLEEHTWSKLLPLIKKMGYMGHDFVAVEVVPDLKKDEYVIQIEPATHSWEKDDFDNSTEVFFNNIIDVMVALGYNSTRKIENSMESLKGGSNNTTKSKPVSEMTINELKQNYKYMDWRRFIQDFLPKNFILNGTEVIRLDNPEYVEDLPEKFKLPTDKVRLVDYLIWRFLAELKDFLPKELRNKPWNDSNDPYKPDRWEKCVQEVLTAFPKTSTAMYVKGHTNPEVEFQVEEIFHELKAELDKMEWLDEAGRNTAMDKLRDMSLYDDVNYIKDTEIDHSGEIFEVVEGDPLQTILNLRKRIIERDYSRLNKPFNKDDRWLKKVENDLLFPRYLKDRNQLYLPTKFVQTVLFNPEREDFINYAIFGSMIARKIAYAVFHRPIGDNTQIKDKNFTTCLTERYLARLNASEQSLHKMTGLSTIVNYMGFRTAYLAYAKSLSFTAKSKTGTPESKCRESFWGNAGFSLCSEYTNTANRYFGHQVPHGSPQIRLDFLSYLQEFRKDFQCPLTPSPNCSLFHWH